MPLLRQAKGQGEAILDVLIIKLAQTHSVHHTHVNGRWHKCKHQVHFRDEEAEASKG